LLLAIMSLAALAVALVGSSAGSAAKADSTLTVWLGGELATATPGSAYRKWWDAEIASFEKQHPGTTVTTVLLNPDGVKQTAQYRAAFGAHKGPDFAMMYPGGFTTTFKAALENLRQIAPDVIKRFSPFTLLFGCDHFNCGNNAPVYTVPMDVSDWILAYNKQIFRKVGIKAPFRSWTALVAAGKKLKAAGYVPFQMGNRDGYISDAYLAAMESSYLTSSDISRVLAGKLSMTDKKFVEPLQLWADLYKQGLTNQNACSLETLASQRDFIAGKAATVASYDYTNMYKQMKDNLGVMTWPPIPGAPNVANAGAAAIVGQGWVVPKGSNSTLATALLRYITSARAQTHAFAIAGIPPANPKASTANAPDPATRAAVQIFQHAKIVGFDAVLPLQTQTTYFKETNLALCGKASPTDAMNAVQKVFNRERKG
jgi:ABC-type glycerol-3-phosphate transport system substrate-binding protein